MRVPAIVLVASLASSASAQGAPPGALACTGCHGLDTDAAMMPLGAYTAQEIATALADYREGIREATIMDRISRGFTPDESQEIAEWFAEQAGEE